MGTPFHGMQTIIGEKIVDLVVMGTVSRAGISGLLMGNTAERVLSHIQASVLTVKPDEFQTPVK